MSFADKVRHSAQRFGGKAKQQMGRATDDERLEAEGRADQTEADIKKAADHAKDAARDVTDR